ncbi:hypothetical protein VOLCADRAFT_93614 [Volvox carteri f. nagariensis]|uniref:Uncharacterized protein n=1 Tax=Volvox carteri f. nagariensis TaxID=3068 RepID=D8U2K6_VOLCA|nr:uncharacterized protein VOLCADRAFT_93614 [Volvox carteri f. nagariensis]EFJ46154.1 hypothetical protein VOLCADRAFT_93614 [Volvox carteri f. nagariensis]|eukprot:XP_002952904.1 hypothetical protein VOLCADRAFT_93614 [Volvox carteri f. nagariensis]
MPKRGEEPGPTTRQQFIKKHPSGATSHPGPTSTSAPGSHSKKTAEQPPPPQHLTAATPWAAATPPSLNPSIAAPILQSGTDNDADGIGFSFGTDIRISDVDVDVDGDVDGCSSRRARVQQISGCVRALKLPCSVVSARTGRNTGGEEEEEEEDPKEQGRQKGRQKGLGRLRRRKRKHGDAGDDDDAVQARDDANDDVDPGRRRFKACLIRTRTALEASRAADEVKKLTGALFSQHRTGAASMAATSIDRFQASAGRETGSCSSWLESPRGDDDGTLYVGIRDGAPAAIEVHDF